MADAKISALTNLTAADAINDMIPIVDVSDTPPASGNTKRISINNILSSSPTASGALTVTGLVTAGSATITGAATVGTTLGVTGNLTVQTDKLAVTTTGVGCGIATPSKQLHVKSTSSTPALIETSGSGLNVIQFTSATGSAYIGNDANAIGFYTTGSADLRMSLAAAGDLSITSGNVVMATSGKGIDFSATASGSGTMTSELLNDYEEGTWTPVVADATTGGNVGTYSLGSATYTKIGRQVYVEFYLLAIGTAGMTAGNALTIRGLPFSATIQAQGSFYTYRVGRNATTVSSSAFVASSNSFVQFFTFSTNPATTDVRILVSDVVSGTSEIRVSVTYTV